MIEIPLNTKIKQLYTAEPMVGTTCKRVIANINNINRDKAVSLNPARMRATKLKRNEAQSALAESTNKGVKQRSKYVTQVQQQRPESPMVTLTWHACKYKVH